MDKTWMPRMFLIKPGGLRNVGRSRQRKQENEENDL
jgi:hypothetical protein